MSVVSALMPSMLAIVQMGTNWSLSIWDIRYRSLERFSLNRDKRKWAWQFRHKCGLQSASVGPSDLIIWTLTGMRAKLLALEAKKYKEKESEGKEGGGGGLRHNQSRSLCCPFPSMRILVSSSGPTAFIVTNRADEELYCVQHLPGEGLGCQLLPREIKLQLFLQRLP